MKIYLAILSSNFCLRLHLSQVFRDLTGEVFLDIHNNVDLRIHVTVEIHLIMGMLPRRFFLQMCMFSLLALHQKKSADFYPWKLIPKELVCVCCLEHQVEAEK